ncbi:MAG TPA: Cof-type HAD-IIB family hydrolase [Mobilitalea sp.]|nr:Cof-type HAD-IIB family hydrolase [Mobilitalea sp.]
MKTKIIFFDIDGTILSHRTDRIAASTIAAIKMAQQNGHLAFINTGRTIAEIEKEITNVGFDGLICGCGTYISYHDNVLLHKSIPSELLPTLVKDLLDNKFEVILEGTSAVYYDDHTTHPRIIKIRDQQISHNFNVKDLDDPAISFDKFCIWTASDEGFQNFYDKYKDTFDFIDRKKRFYEVVPKGYSKATGIEFLLKHLNIPHENTYALGDSTNDLSMLNFVKHSIAMGNSHEDIRNIVSFVTEDVDQDGIAYALKHFSII